jgi:hypothetical protein
VLQERKFSLGGGTYEIALYQKAGVGTGISGWKPMVTRMPDTVTKVTWDNYVTMSYEDMSERNCEHW